MLSFTRLFYDGIIRILSEQIYIIMYYTKRHKITPKFKVFFMFLDYIPVTNYMILRFRRTVVERDEICKNIFRQFSAWDVYDVPVKILFTFHDP